jgi:hypothetical protein
LAPSYRHSSSYFYSLWRRHFYETWYIVRNYFPYFFRTLGKLQPRQGSRYREMQEHQMRLVDKVGEECGRPKQMREISGLQEPPFESKLDFFTHILERPLKKITAAAGGILLFSYLWSLVSGWILSSGMNLFFRTTFSLLLNYGFILMGLLMVLFILKPSRSGTSYREAEPATLRKKAARIAEILQVKYVTFGHCHIEDIWKIPGRDSWYFNTGTWSPFIDDEIRTIRPDLQFPVVVLEGSQARLMRWNDATGELEDLPVLEDRALG